MQKFIIIHFLLLCANSVWGQNCPSLIEPLNNATNVSVDSAIRWNSVEGITGFIVNVGTSPNGTDIINRQANGSSTVIQPPLGMPENTRIYVTIILFFFDRPDITCASQSFTTENVITSPECSALLQPNNGDDNVNISTNINWRYASGATGYKLFIGTDSGVYNFVNNLDIGNTLTYNPPNNLLPNTRYYLSIVPYNENGNAENCDEYLFTTGELVTLPGCSQLLSPVDGETNVALSPLLEWRAVSGATGYKVYIGKTPNDNNILDGAVFTTTSTNVINFEDNHVYFVRIVPFNEGGSALDCGQESFSTVLGCGPFYSLETGELIDLRPQITFPDTVGICNGISTYISTDDQATGFRWFKANFSGDILISSERQVSILDEGLYILEAYNTTNGGPLECVSRKEFEVVASEAPIINNIDIEELADGLNIAISVSGSGNYEFAIKPNGPYQDSNIINGASLNTQYIYARDKNGCGITEYELRFVSSFNGFPKFFSPNGDGYNDYWQYSPKGNEDFIVVDIYIFNRYGMLIKIITPGSNDWDGKINGMALPISDYWYRALTQDGRTFSGHFSLLR